MDLTMLLNIADAILLANMLGREIVMTQDRVDMCYRTGDIVHTRSEMIVVPQDEPIVLMREFVTLRELNPVSVMRSNRRIAF